MDRYQMEAPALIKVWDTVLLSKLLDLMEEYVRALANFPDQAPPASALATQVKGDEAGAVLLFTADDQGFLSSITLPVGTDAILLSYCMGGSCAAVMERGGGTCSFAGTVADISLAHSSPSILLALSILMNDTIVHKQGGRANNTSFATILCRIDQNIPEDVCVEAAFWASCSDGGFGTPRPSSWGARPSPCPSTPCARRRSSIPCSIPCNPSPSTPISPASLPADLRIARRET